MSIKTTFTPFTLTCRGTLRHFARPAIMGILNVTPDSFFDGGRYQTERQILDRVASMLAEGADIIDIGTVSSRPGAQLLPPDEEARRLAPLVAMVRKAHPEALISVDTCFSQPAEKAIEAGADIINDISGGMFDCEMLPTAARLKVPYILMHNVGTPDHMQDAPHYDNILDEVSLYFSQRLETLYKLGATDVLIDPGFGFGKTVDHNYRLFAALDRLRILFPREPLLVALSRKSMIFRLLGTSPQEALNGTTVLHSLALAQGAQLLRVHDVREAAEAVAIVGKAQAEADELD